MKARRWSLLGWPSVLLVCLTLLGPVLFLLGDIHDSQERWKPVSVLVPGAYATATVNFFVKVPGDYHFEVSKYITDDQRDPDSLPTNRLVCNLRMIIYYS